MEEPGVYIGKDAELVRTGLYEILIRRKSTEGKYFLEAGLSRFYEGEKELLGLCEMDNTAQVIRHAMKHKNRNECGDVEDLFMGNDKELLSCLGGRYNYTEQNDGENIMLSFDDSDTYELKLAEQLSPLPPREKPALNEGNIGKTLSEWIRGTYSQGENEEFWFGVIINTKKHMYIYTMPLNFIYIRAARYACCNQGVVFAQNIRMFDNSGKFRKAFMLDNNLEAAESLQVDSTHFKRNQCNTPQSFDRGIYWSLKEVRRQDETIVLNGCEGNDYEFPRNRDNLVEYFK